MASVPFPVHLIGVVWYHTFSYTDILGGYDGINEQDNILQFNPDDGSWTQVGQLQVAREAHAVSLVNAVDLIDYCQ